MDKIIMNLQYSISLECLFATLGQAVSAWKYLDVDISDVYLKTLNKEKAKIESEIKRVNGKLSNQGFVSKAPEKLVNEEKAKKEKYEEMLKSVLERLENIEAKIK